MLPRSVSYSLKPDDFCISCLRNFNVAPKPAFWQPFTAFLHSSNSELGGQDEGRRADKHTAVLSGHHKYLYCEKYHKIIPTILEKTVPAF